MLHATFSATSSLYVMCVCQNCAVTTAQSPFASAHVRPPCFAQGRGLEEISRPAET